MAAHDMLIRAPPPIPCRARKRTSCSMLCDSPAAADATAKATMPPNSTGRRPTRSDSRP